MSQISQRKIQVDWGHLLVATLIVIGCIWYLLDARDSSLRIGNLIFVQPAVIFAVILYVLILPQCFRWSDTGASTSPDESNPDGPQTLTLRQFLRVASLAAAFGLFIVGMETLGFDVSAWLFMIVGLFITGERRWWVLAVFPAVFAVLVVYGYDLLIPYSFPTMFL
jgi:hypothetical protein